MDIQNAYKGDSQNVRLLNVRCYEFYKFTNVTKLFYDIYINLEYNVQTLMDKKCSGKLTIKAFN